MRTTALVAAAILLCGMASGGTALEERIAARHRVEVSDKWGGGHRMIFDFNGRRAWVIEPTAAANGKPWVWTMQWMGAYLNRTGAPDLVRKGFHHVHLEAFDTRANAEGLKALAEFQDYLVKTLGLNAKANLIGMSWGGFYSVRYANAYPQNVAKIYLDAPLLNFTGFGDTPETAAQIGPWAADAPKDGVAWTDDPRMPVNMAESIARGNIPVYLLYGGQDQTVNPKLNCEPFIERFRKAGGNLIHKRRTCYGHHPHGFEHEDIHLIVEYFAGEMCADGAKK